MNNKQKEIFDIAEQIINDNKKVLENYHDFADSKNHNDRGIEGWFQFELISAFMENDDIEIEHLPKGADLKFNDREDIELRATTSFHPCYVLDGFLDHEKKTVLFFSGYNKFFKKINQPNLTDEKDVFNCFKNYIDNSKRKKKLGKDSIDLEYKVIDLKKPCILGLLKKSGEFKYKRIKN